MGEEEQLTQIEMLLKNRVYNSISKVASKVGVSGCALFFAAFPGAVREVTVGDVGQGGIPHNLMD